MHPTVESSIAALKAANLELDAAEKALKEHEAQTDPLRQELRRALTVVNDARRTLNYAIECACGRPLGNG